MHTAEHWHWKKMNKTLNSFNRLKPRQNGCHFADDIFKFIFLNGNVLILLQIDWSLLLGVQLTLFKHWFRWWLGAVQTASHCLNQWWLVWRCLFVSLGLNELINTLKVSLWDMVWTSLLQLPDHHFSYHWLSLHGCTWTPLSPSVEWSQLTNFPNFGKNSCINNKLVLISHNLYQRIWLCKLISISSITTKCNSLMWGNPHS